MKKSGAIIAAIASILLVFCSVFVYWIFFVPEFAYIEINASSRHDQLSVTSRPAGILNGTKIHPWTAIHLQLQNAQDTACKASITSSADSEQVEIPAGSSYSLLPKRGARYHIELCGKQKDLDLNKL